MATHLHCITCGHKLPGEEDHPGYFAQSALRPKDWGDFADELANLLRHMRAVFITLTSSFKDLDDDVVSELHDLGWALSEEAQRRLELMAEALNQQKDNGQTARAEG